ncbi:MAG: ZIP family metal transporter [Gemmatimonadota bacterium]
MTIGPLAVFVAALITALATGLGALPLLFFQGGARRWLGVSNAAAAGFMAAASGGLIFEGLAYSPAKVVVGIGLGVLFVASSSRLLQGHQDVRLGILRGADALKAMMLIGVMTLHSATEGVGVGVSFGGGQALGLLITIAIAVHNIPEGLAISLELVPRGVKVRHAAAWSIFSSLPQPLLAVPAFLFVEAFAPFLPVGLGFAAGAMLWIVLRELLPDALKEAEGTTVALAAALSVIAMIALQILLHV